jgi:transposase
MEVEGGTMPKQLNFRLDEQGRKAIETAMKSDPRAEVRQRATALRLLDRGHSPREVAGMLAVSLASVYTWLHHWEAEGLEGLANRPKQGRRRKVTPAYCEALEAALAREPASFGYRFAVWTLERLRDHLTHQTGIALTVQWLSVLLDELGYVYRRPKHDLTHLQNANAKQQALELLDELKKGHTTRLSAYSLWTKHP